MGRPDVSPKCCLQTLYDNNFELNRCPLYVLIQGPSTTMCMIKKINGKVKVPMNQADLLLNYVLICLKCFEIFISVNKALVFQWFRFNVLNKEHSLKLVWHYFFNIVVTIILLYLSKKGNIFILNYIQ